VVWRWCSQASQFQARMIQWRLLTRLPKLVPTSATWAAVFCADPIRAMWIFSTEEIPTDRIKGLEFQADFFNRSNHPNRGTRQRH
jgi:hypothetical protein